MTDINLYIDSITMEYSENIGRNPMNHPNRITVEYGSGTPGGYTTSKLIIKYSPDPDSEEGKYPIHGIEFIHIKEDGEEIERQMLENLRMQLVSIGFTGELPLFDADYSDRTPVYP